MKRILSMELKKAFWNKRFFIFFISRSFFVFIKRLFTSPGIHHQNKVSKYTGIPKCC